MRLSKTHQDYWTKRIEKRSYTRSDGSVETINEWQVRICHKGKREWFQLGSSNKIVASKRAADIYQSLKLNGWEATIREFKGVMEVKKKAQTIGDYLAVVEETGVLAPKTFALYYRWLRAIAAQSKGIPHTKHKYDYKNGGLAEWRKKVDAIPLEYLTPDRVRKWQRDFVARAGSDPVAIRKAEHSANSAIRNARSLFSNNLLSHIKGVELPSPLPFEGVALLKSGSMRYRSSMDTAQLVKDATSELSQSDPNAYIIFLLSLFAGLRRNEIDKLRWASIDFDKGMVHIEPHAYFTPKTEHSIGTARLDEEVMEILRQHKKSHTSEYVIDSRNEPRLGCAYDHYRADKSFRALVKWLRSKGVDTNSPIHTLRKEFGRLITEQYGIYAASKALRHGGIQITAAHYADDKRQILVKMKSLTGETASPERG